MKKYFLFLLLFLIYILSCSSQPDFSKQSSDIPSVGYVGCTKGVEELLPVEEGVIDEMNVARTNPKYYIQFLEERKKRFTGKIMRVPGQIPITTREGTAAVDEAILFLKSQQPLKPLKMAKCLCLSARDHAIDQGSSGGLGHIGSDKSTFMDRINRYVSDYIYGGENISYGPHSAREIVLDLIIDDGVASRGHRKNIFNPDFRSVGVGFGEHTTFRYVCVIDFSYSRIN